MLHLASKSLGIRPPAVSGRLANPNDPYVTASLAGGALAFVPTANKFAACDLRSSLDLQFTVPLMSSQTLGAWLSERP
jgi:hypothetical protein